MNTILSLFDYSGNWSRPYKEAGFNVIQVDIKYGIDILTWDYTQIKDVYGILAACPCTDFANSGAKHFEAKDNDGRTAESIKLVNKTLEIINYFSPAFWTIENPMSRIHRVNLGRGLKKGYNELGKPKLKFNPCDYAGYDPEPDKSRYNKKTWLWGSFNIPEHQYLEPFEKEFPGWKKLGGKSEKTKELRSETPLGFAYAFFEANN